MKIRMLEDAVASENGIDIKAYKAGQEYNILGAIGYSFIKRKLAEPVEEVLASNNNEQANNNPEHEEKNKQPHQNKALKGSPENKSHHGAK